jgi:hypothetical protein
LKAKQEKAKQDKTARERRQAARMAHRRDVAR